MAMSSKNLEDGMILPRATPARSGTRHSISVTPRAVAQALASRTLVTAVGAWAGGAFFLLIGVLVIGLFYDFIWLSGRIGCVARPRSGRLARTLIVRDATCLRASHPPHRLPARILKSAASRHAPTHARVGAVGGFQP